MLVTLFLSITYFHSRSVQHPIPKQVLYRTEPRPDFKLLKINLLKIEKNLILTLEHPPKKQDVLNIKLLNQVA